MPNKRIFRAPRGSFYESSYDYYEWTSNKIANDYSERMNREPKKRLPTNASGILPLMPYTTGSGMIPFKVVDYTKVPQDKMPELYATCSYSSIRPIGSPINGNFSSWDNPPIKIELSDPLPIGWADTVVKKYLKPSKVDLDKCEICGITEGVSLYGALKPTYMCLKCVKNKLGMNKKPVWKYLLKLVGLITLSGMPGYIVARIFFGY